MTKLLFVSIAFFIHSFALANEPERIPVCNDELAVVQDPVPTNKPNDFRSYEQDRAYFEEGYDTEERSGYGDALDPGGF